MKLLPVNRTSSRQGSGSRQAGFTLVEVLVAFIVLALLTLTIQKGMSTILRATDSVEDRSEADLVARSLMTGPVITQDLAAGLRRGELYGLDWSMTITPVDLGGPGPDAAAATSAGSDWIPARIRIAVTRPGGGSPLSSVELIRVLSSGPE